MARRSKHSQAEIKQMVLEAAEEIVQEQGFSALKVRKIAADIGYTVGSIYMVFTNINDLNMHIKARTWQKLQLYLLNNTDQCTPVTLSNVKNMAIAYLDFTLLNKGLWLMLFEHQLPVEVPVPDWYLQENERITAFASSLLMQLNGTYSDVQVQQAARTLINCVQGVCMQVMMQPQSIENIKQAKGDVVFLVDCLMQAWINGAE